MKKMLFRGIWAIGLLGLLNAFQLSTAQTNNYNLAFTLTVSNTAIDRIIGSQWASNTHSWSGPLYWGTYTLTLNQPTIILSDNGIKLAMYLNISSPIYNNSSLLITPTLTIPATNVNATSIITLYSDLQQQINNYISDSGLRSIIYQKLSAISWMVYQGQILNASTTRLSSINDIALNGLPTLSFAIASNSLIVTVSETIAATTPWYKIKTESNSSDNNHLRLRLESDVNFSSSSIRLSTTSQGYAWTQTANLASTYDPTNQIYYLEVETNEPSLNYDYFNGLIQWAFTRGSNQVIRSAIGPNNVDGTSFIEWTNQYAINHGSYGY
jgi:hypothetical protein